MEEILIELMKMYDNGELDNEFDEELNEMVPSVELEALMEQARPLLPQQLEGSEAANLMRDLDAETRDKEIKKAGQKVIDMRKSFRKKMSDNGGALGLIQNYVAAKETNDEASAQQALENMLELIHGPE